MQPTDSVCRRPAQEAALCAGTCELGSVRITCVVLTDVQLELSTLLLMTGA